MGLSFRSLNGILILVAAAAVFPSAARSQTTSPSAPTDQIALIRLLKGNESVADTFNRAYFKNDPNFFRNRSVKNQLDLIFGPGSLIRNSFPENKINRDAELIDILYQDTLRQQVSSDPIIRTRDLPNPYETSILQSPGLKGNSPVEGR